MLITAGITRRLHRHRGAIGSVEPNPDRSGSILIIPLSTGQASTAQLYVTRDHDNLNRLSRQTDGTWASALRIAFPRSSPSAPTPSPCRGDLIDDLVPLSSTARRGRALNAASSDGNAYGSRWAVRVRRRRATGTLMGRGAERGRGDARRVRCRGQLMRGRRAPGPSFEHPRTSSRHAAGRGSTDRCEELRRARSPSRASPLALRSKCVEGR